jgi:hypothetical protein
LPLCALFFLFISSLACEANADRDRSLELLDMWTSIRWGDENLAWIVHYPEALIEPWISAEAERRGFRPDQTEAYRKAFMDELRIDSTTPILFSVQVLGPRPLDLSPLADNIALVDGEGKRVRPMVIEKKLDGPLHGLVQGFVFFPKQSADDFRIAVKGLVPERETVFAFDGASRGVGAIATTTGGRGTTVSEPPVEEVIVKIPTTSKPAQPKVEPTSPPEEAVPESEVFEPTQPVAPPPEEPRIDQVQTAQREQPQAVSAALRLSPRQVLDIYLKSWIAGDTERMYELLSTESRDKISRDLFNREIMNGGFRNLLKSGYKVNWLSEDSAKVTVARKLLLMRFLESKRIDFVEEDGSAHVSW